MMQKSWSSNIIKFEFFYMKKIIIPLIVFTALFLIIYSPEKESQDIDIKSGLENDLIEIREDKILSGKAGLSFDIPKGWNVERDGDEVELLTELH